MSRARGAFFVLTRRRDEDPPLVPNSWTRLQKFEELFHCRFLEQPDESGRELQFFGLAVPVLVEHDDVGVSDGYGRMEEIPDMIRSDRKAIGNEHPHQPSDGVACRGAFSEWFEGERLVENVSVLT